MKLGVLAVTLAECRRVAGRALLKSKNEVYVLSKIIFCAVETILNSVGRYHEARGTGCAAG